MTEDMSEDTHEQYDVLGREFIKRYLDMFEPLVEKLCDTISISESWDGTKHDLYRSNKAKMKLNFWITQNSLIIKIQN